LKIDDPLFDGFFTLFAEVEHLQNKIAFDSLGAYQPHEKIQEMQAL
jgi:hypothetical protein